MSSPAEGDAVLRLRCPADSTGGFSWRTPEQNDFSEGQSASFKAAATPDWQEVKVALPATGRIIHVRLAFSGPVMPEIAGLELRGANTTVTARWAAAPKPSQP